MYFLINNSDKYTSERNNASIILGDALLQPFGRSPKVSNESFISLLPTCHPDVHCWQLTWHSRNYIYFPLEASCPAPPFPTNPDSDPIPRRTFNPIPIPIPIPSPRNENEAKTSQPLRLRRSPPRRAAADNGRRRPAAAGGRGRPARHEAERELRPRPGGGAPHPAPPRRGALGRRRRPRRARRVPAQGRHDQRGVPDHLARRRRRRRGRGGRGRGWLATAGGKEGGELARVRPRFIVGKHVFFSLSSFFFPPSNMAVTTVFPLLSFVCACPPKMA